MTKPESGSTPIEGLTWKQVADFRSAQYTVLRTLEHLDGATATEELVAMIRKVSKYHDVFPSILSMPEIEGNI